MLRAVMVCRCVLDVCDCGTKRALRAAIACGLRLQDFFSTSGFISNFSGSAHDSCPNQSNHLEEVFLYRALICSDSTDLYNN